MRRAEIGTATSTVIKAFTGRQLQHRMRPGLYMPVRSYMVCVRVCCFAMAGRSCFLNLTLPRRAEWPSGRCYFSSYHSATSATIVTSVAIFTIRIAENQCHVTVVMISIILDATVMVLHLLLIILIVIS